MRVFARKTQGANGGKLGLCASLAALAVAVLLLALAGCKNSSGGDAPASTAPIHNPVPPAPVPESKDEDDASNALSFNFYVDDIKVGKTARFATEQAFGDILAKAAVAGKYDEEGFEGWAVKGGDIVADNSILFSASTDFVAMYKQEDAKLSSIDMSDIVNFDWFDAKTSTIMSFVDEGNAKLITGKTAQEASIIVNTYKTMDSLYYSVGNGDPLKAVYKAKKEEAEANFSGELASWTDENKLELFDFSTGDISVYYMRKDKKALIDENDNVVYTRM